MRNFSLYELLSYLILGYFFIKAFGWFFNQYIPDFSFEFQNDIESSAVALILSLIIGVFIHRITRSDTSLGYAWDAMFDL